MALGTMLNSEFLKKRLTMARVMLPFYCANLSSRYLSIYSSLYPCLIRKSLRAFTFLLISFRSSTTSPSVLTISASFTLSMLCFHLPKKCLILYKRTCFSILVTNSSLNCFLKPLIFKVWKASLTLFLRRRPKIEVMDF